MNYLEKATNELLTYYTPQKVIDFIKSEKMKTIIGNPPYKIFDKKVVNSE